MKDLFKYLKKYPKESILAPLFKMLEAIFDLLVPLVIVYMINGINLKNSNQIELSFIQLIVMAFVGLFFCVIAQYYSAKVATSTASELRKDLYEHINNLDYSDLDQLGSSTLITRMTSDVNLIQNGINLFLRLFLRSPFIVFGCLYMAFRINKQISLIFLLLIIALFAVIVLIMKLTNPMYKENQNLLDRLTTLTKENLTGVRVVRAFNQEQQEVQQYSKQNNLLVQGQLIVGKISSLLNPLTYILVNLAIVFVLYLGAIKTNNSILTAASVIALVNYLSQILVELVKLANLVVSISKSIASIERVEKILSIQPSMKYGNETIDKTKNPILKMKDVSFSYSKDGEPVLRNINLEVKKNETVGIIGSTGCGKSALINLIARFYDASNGSIELFGKDIKNYSKNQIRNCIGVVPQRAQLLSGTIRSNLVMANESISDEEILQALKIAQAQDFVMEKGLDSEVEQQGRNFSGGQKQRLTIARALLKNPSILILDDSCSALDYATDAKLRKELKKLKEVTTFIVSQRTSSIESADKIIVLEEGEIVGCGKHKELLKNCSVYKEIYLSQYQKEGAQR